jgi:hypothetical protein
MKILKNKQKRNWHIALMLVISAIAAMLYWDTKNKNKSNSIKIY